MTIESDATRAMADDIKRDVQVLAVKRRILKTLRSLPDDETRRRVIGAVSVMLGYADVVRRESP